LMYHVGFIYIGDTAPIIQLASWANTFLGL
jgi:hypothetical protein